MKKMRSLLAIVIVCTAAGGTAGAHQDAHRDPASTRCDTWTRPEKTYSHDNTDRADVNPDQTVDTPEDLYVMGGGGRYGVRGRDFYLEALGGGGYGSGQTTDPQHRSAEGGVVQGEVDVAQAPADADFSVNAFSPADETNNARWYDTAAGACISVADHRINTKEQYVPTATLPHP